ncbi:hypothetical protein W97_03653 [Coniosporium apollinis CBS 100218]|uniref:EGF domain-specific O-linked N-acetylglucosamine transferase n=1 Tax=Coniosporium apollinis (strain CBS 100218) TaxID=1168221 RepID=R7YR76_CONA1|nr:uncharacterized protein W97_03653 [Coniosporium apollinis CBS 100218]EON64422.1 hypothetical protein W97_03653 [Coniosporium apollinis CBS 100218]
MAYGNLSKSLIYSQLGSSAVRKSLLLSLVLVSIFLLCWSNSELFSWSPTSSPSDHASTDRPSKAPVVDELDHDLQIDEPAPHNTPALPSVAAVPTVTPGSLRLPAEYYVESKDDPRCEDTYGLNYLYSLQRSGQQYCKAASSTSTLNCFHTNITTDHTDSFCIASSVSIDPHAEHNPFGLDCHLRNFAAEAAASNSEPVTPDFQTFPDYMFETGPHRIFDDWFKNITHPLRDETDATRSACAGKKSATDGYTILIKRDGGGHLWHSQMEIFSLLLTLDVLRSTTRSTSTPYFTSADIANAQVVLLDSHPDGPFFDLWRLFAKKPVLRLKEWQAQLAAKSTAGEPLCLNNVLLPLPGASNPMWQGDWTPHDCTHSALLSTYVERLKTHYNIPSPSARDPKAPITVTFIDRRKTRKLHNQDAMLKALQRRFPAPDFHIQAVDLAHMSFREQTEIMARTDVLAAVHGAGLTHAVFLPPEASVVEMLPPAFGHKGFRNLAKLRGLRYFSVHMDEKEQVEGWDGNWQAAEELVVGEEVFERVMEVAVGSVLQRGTRDGDVGVL